jgi:adenylate cyclase
MLTSAKTIHDFTINGNAVSRGRCQNGEIFDIKKKIIIQRGYKMGIEIERKFIVKDLQWMSKSTKPKYIRQGYLSTEPNRTVRIRVVNNIGKITIKGANQNGSRPEYEYDIPLGDAKELLDKLCPKPQIEKNRYEIIVGSHTWEVDEFLGANDGLIIAEVELENINEKILIPEWAGLEVTTDHRYSNSNLTLHPFPTW